MSIRPLSTLFNNIFQPEEERPRDQASIIKMTEKFERNKGLWLNLNIY
jgi:hypothetical protein